MVKGGKAITSHVTLVDIGQNNSLRESLEGGGIWENLTLEFTKSHYGVSDVGPVFYILFNKWFLHYHVTYHEACLYSLY